MSSEIEKSVICSECIKYVLEQIVDIIAECCTECIEVHVGEDDVDVNKKFIECIFKKLIQLFLKYGIDISAIVYRCVW